MNYKCSTFMTNAYTDICKTIKLSLILNFRKVLKAPSCIKEPNISIILNCF